MADETLTDAPAVISPAATSPSSLSATDQEPPAAVTGSGGVPAVPPA